MDLNLVVLSGRLASEPETRVFESGSRLLRLLVTVRQEAPRRRIDVIPVSLWDPPEEVVMADLHPGSQVWVSGSVQRRFFEGPDGRRGRIEVIAAQVRTGPSEVTSGPASPFSPSRGA